MNLGGFSVGWGKGPNAWPSTSCYRLIRATSAVARLVARVTPHLGDGGGPLAVAIRDHGSLYFSGALKTADEGSTGHDPYALLLSPIRATSSPG